MAASLRASESGLEIVDLARKKKGLTQQASSLCGNAQTSVATLKRFWEGKPIQQEVFVKICKVVGVNNWEDISDRPVSCLLSDRSSIASTSSKLSKFSFIGSVKC